MQELPVTVGGRDVRGSGIRLWTDWYQHLFLKPTDRVLVVWEIDIDKDSPNWYAVNVYADETGHEGGPAPDVFGFAGFIAATEEWTAFVKRWEAACPPEDYPFHMKTFCAKYKPEQQLPIMVALVDAITQSRLVPIYAVTRLPAVSHPRSAAERRHIYSRLIYRFAIEMEVSVLEGVDPEDPSCAPFPAVPTTRLVFAARQNADQVRNEWLGGRGPLMAQLSSLYTRCVSIGSPKDIPPLQAADLFAWEVGHHFRVIQERRKEERKSFTRIKTELSSILGIGVKRFVEVRFDDLGNDEVIVLGA